MRIAPAEVGTVSLGTICVLFVGVFDGASRMFETVLEHEAGFLGSKPVILCGLGARETVCGSIARCSQRERYRKEGLTNLGGMLLFYSSQPLVQYT